MKLTFEITKQDLYDQDILSEVGEKLPRTKYENEEDFIHWLKHNLDEVIFLNGFCYQCEENILLIDNLPLDEFIEANKKELIDYFKDEFDVFFVEEETDGGEIKEIECCANCKRSEDVGITRNEVLCNKRERWVKYWNKCKYWK